jgi:hypothetical protein
MVWNALNLESGGQGVPGPRDWWPGMEDGKEALKILKKAVPAEMVVSMEEIRETDWPEITRLAEQDLGFIIKLAGEYHLLFLDRKGVRMDITVSRAFHFTFIP